MLQLALQPIMTLKRHFPAVFVTSAQLEVDSGLMRDRGGQFLKVKGALGHLAWLQCDFISFDSN